MSVEIAVVEKRSVLDAMWRSALCRCPNCGKGKLYRSYLKVNDSCAECGEELSHHRADDLPPYIAIMIVGHVLVGVMLHLEMAWHVSPTFYLYTLVPLAIILPLLMLPSIKGAVVGMQWANLMHGFDCKYPDPAAPDDR